MARPLKAVADYDVHSIQAFEGLEGPRRKPGMYVGETDRRGVVHLFKEVFGNSSDEATNGHGKVIRVLFAKDGSITVADEGRGIPVGPFPKDKTRDTLTVIMTVLHSGGKFDKGKENYSKGRIGTHGVGLGVVNALSEYLEVWSWRNNTWNYQGFERGVPTKPKPVETKSLPKDLGLEHPNKGTVVRFSPDLSCFSKGAKFDPNLAYAWLDDISWLIGDVEIELHNEFDKEYATLGPEVLHRPNGLHDRFEHELQKLGVEADFDPFVFHSDALDVLIGWTTHTDEVLYSAVGAIRTSEHGTHVKGLEASINECFAAYAKKNDEFKNDFLRSGMIAVINIKMDEPRFNSQDKVKLINDEARDIVLNELAPVNEKGQYVNSGLYAYLNQNRQLVELVLNRAKEFTALHAGFKASKKLAAEYRVEQRGGKIILPKDLKVSTTDNPEERELYIVEGGSAGGSGQMARDSTTQEVYPLSGKILNVHRQKNLEKALFSERIKELMQSIGYQPEKPKTYRVGKIILLTDADDDGSHIAALLLGLIHRVVPDLIESGRVFVADAPLFIYRTDKSNVYGASLRDLQEKVKIAHPKATFKNDNVERIKGWGQCPWDILRTVAFERSTRKLTRVTPAMVQTETKKIIDLMGEDVAARKILLGLDG